MMKGQEELFEICKQMRAAGLSTPFISAALKAAVKYGGVADLMKYWRDETEEADREAFIATIQELINECYGGSLMDPALCSAKGDSDG